MYELRVMLPQRSIQVFGSLYRRAADAEFPFRVPETAYELNSPLTGMRTKRTNDCGFKPGLFSPAKSDNLEIRRSGHN